MKDERPCRRHRQSAHAPQEDREGDEMSGTELLDEILQVIDEVLEGPGTDGPTPAEDDGAAS